MKMIKEMGLMMASAGMGVGMYMLLTNKKTMKSVKQMMGSMSMNTNSKNDVKSN